MARTHYHTTTPSTTTTSTDDDLAACMAGGHVRKHRHGATPVQGSTQAWGRSSSMKDTAARRGSTRAAGAQSADWGHAR